jgi:hypothetical protein
VFADSGTVSINISDESRQSKVTKHRWFDATRIDVRRWDMTDLRSRLEERSQIKQNNKSETQRRIGRERIRQELIED